MWLNIALIFFIVVCAGAMGYIIMKKLALVKTLDLSTVAEEQAAQVRNRLLFERMKRQTIKGGEKIKKIAAPFFSWLAGLFKFFLKKITELEKKYQKEATNQKPVLSGQELQNKVNALLNEAGALFKPGRLREAEKKLIELICLDQKNIGAYNFLAQIYIAQKEFKQALQTQQFMLKLAMKKSRQSEKAGNKEEAGVFEVADIYAGMGAIYEAMEKWDKALEVNEKALALEPNSPRRIDKVIQIALRLKKTNLAKELIERLAQVNPDNQKLIEYQNQI